MEDIAQSRYGCSVARFSIGNPTLVIEFFVLLSELCTNSGFKILNQSCKEIITFYANIDQVHDTLIIKLMQIRFMSVTS